MTNLAQFRLALVSAKETLRTAKTDHETIKAIREQAAIDGGRLAACKNETERTRALLIALDNDSDYIQARDRLRDAEYEVDRIQAEIATCEDQLTADKLRVRDAANQALDRYSAALLRMAPQNPVSAAIDGAIEVKELPF